MTATVADVDLDFFLVDSTFETVAAGATDANPESISQAVLTPGTYYFVVNGFDTTTVNNGDDATPYTLDFVSIEPAECSDDAGCVGNANGLACDLTSLTCVVCVDSFDCSGATPACASENNVQVCRSYDDCTGDDTMEPANDGPSGAAAVVLGTASAAKVCGDFDSGSGENEDDWFTFTLAAASNTRVTASWDEADPAAPTKDIDFVVYDDAGASIVSGAGTAQPEVRELMALPAGTYFVKVDSFKSDTLAVAYDYTLLVETF